MQPQADEKEEEEELQKEEEFQGNNKLGDRTRKNGKEVVAVAVVAVVWIWIRRGRRGSKIRSREQDGWMACTSVRRLALVLSACAAAVLPSAVGEGEATFLEFRLDSN